MFETLSEALGLSDTSPQQASIVFGLVVGVLFGIFAQTTGFCLRRAIAGKMSERGSAGGVWAIALLSALIGTQLMLAYSPVSLADHRFMNAQIPVVALLTGGLLFGIGMVMTRGCISRLTVLTGSGNLRALMVLLLFAVVAHATLKGVLAPLRIWIGSYTWDSSTGGSLVSLPGGQWLYTALISALLLLIIRRSQASKALLLGGIMLGALVPLTWWGTGWLLVDDFDPIPLENLSFTLPHTQLAFWTMTSSAVPASFGVGLIGGVVLASLIMHLLRGQFHWQSFGSVRQTGRYLAGGSLMAVGGVLAGGCTVGAGLSGVSTLSLSAIIALLSILLGAVIAARSDTASH